MQQVAIRRESGTGRVPVLTPADNAMAAVEQSGEFLTELVCMTRLVNGASSQGRPLFVLWRLYDEEFKQASNDQTDESN